MLYISSFKQLHHSLWEAFFLMILTQEKRCTGMNMNNKYYSTLQIKSRPQSRLSKQVFEITFL